MPRHARRSPETQWRLRQRHAMPARRRRAAQSCIFSITTRSSPKGGMRRCSRVCERRTRRGRRFAASISGLDESPTPAASYGATDEGWNYGRGDAPRDWRYRSPRDVDYGSAASLMVEPSGCGVPAALIPLSVPPITKTSIFAFALRAAGYRDRLSTTLGRRSCRRRELGKQPARRGPRDSRTQPPRFAQRWPDVLREHSSPGRAQSKRRRVASPGADDPRRRRRRAFHRSRRWLVSPGLSDRALARARMARDLRRHDRNEYEPYASSFVRGVPT